MSPARPWATLLMLAGVAVGIGWRTMTSAGLVLPSLDSAGISVRHKTFLAAEAREERMVKIYQGRADALNAVTSGKLAPNPFRPRWTPRPKPKADQESLKVEVPIVVLTAVDVARPEVVLKTGGQASGLLSTGNTWNGWTVLRISPNGVDVEGFGEKHRLPVPSREQ